LLTIKEIILIAEEVETDLEGIDLSWTKEDNITSRELEDELTQVKKHKGEGMSWLPKEVRKAAQAALPPETIHRGNAKTGIYVIRKILMNAVENEETICGRLYLL
jgi:hypothetical protein